VCIQLIWLVSVPFINYFEAATNQCGAFGKLYSGISVVHKNFVFGSFISKLGSFILHEDQWFGYVWNRLFLHYSFACMSFKNIIKSWYKLHYFERPS
jgi:hypothetical protein